MLINPSVRLVLKKKRASDKEGYICVRIGVSGYDYKYPSTNYKIPERFWNAEDEVVKRGLSDYQEINKAISDKKLEYLEKLKTASKKGKVAKDRINDIIGKRGKGDGFVGYWEGVINTMKEVDKNGKPKRSAGYTHLLQSQLNVFKEFAGEDVTFEDINTQFLRRYEAHRRKKVNGSTTLATTFKKLKNIIKRAINDGHINAREVSGFEWPAYESPIRAYLTVEQTQSIWELLNKGGLDHMPHVRTTAAYFLMECYAGIRFSDWGAFSIEKLIDKDNFKVRATKKTGEPIYLPLNKSPRLRKVLQYIKKHGLKVAYTEQEANRNLKVLAGLVNLPHITTHIGRHTCATLLLEIGYSNEYVAEFLGISEQVVKIYAKVTRRKLQNEYERLGGL